MSEQSSEPTAEGLIEAEVTELRRLLANSTPGRWKLWGMQVMADQDGTGNVETALPVAQTYFRDEHDKPRTWDASLIAEAHNLLPALLAERDAALAALDRVKALLAAYCAWDGDPDSEFSSSPRQREQLRAAVEGGRS